MTFKEIEKGQPVYILNKDNMDYMIGKVVEKSLPYMDKNSNGMNLLYLVDITIEVNGQKGTYVIPTDMSITYTGDLALATDSDLILKEITKINGLCADYLKNYDRYQNNYHRSEELMIQLNPALKQQRDNERRFDQLEGGLKGLTDTVNQLAASNENMSHMFMKLMDKLNSKDK